MNKVPEVKEHWPFTIDKHSSEGYSGYLIFVKPLSKNRFSTLQPQDSHKGFLLLFYATCYTSQNFMKVSQALPKFLRHDKMA